MKKKILIVDDEPNIIMTLEYSLKKKNYDILVARDGSEVISLLDSTIPDLVLLDIMMPEIDGYETLKYLKSKADFKNIKVVFLSAKTKKSDIEKGMEAGADGYITKPFTIKNIVKTIEELIN